MPKVSVIIPNYNYATFLEQRLETVLNQTYPDFEVIFLDDASTDHSREVFQKYQGDDRVRAFFNPVNSGNTFKQWNLGMRLARGEYIWIAEADDYSSPRFLEELVGKMDQNPSVGLAYCQSWRVDEEGRIISSLEEWTADLDGERWKRDYINRGREECRDYLVLRNTIPNASAVLMRKSQVEPAGYPDENYVLAGDWMMWIKILLGSDVAYLAEPLNYFRIHSRAVRVKTLGEGRYHRENYLILKFIQDQLEVPVDNIERAREELLHKWFLGARNRSFPWRMNLQIYDVAQAADPRLRSRLVAKLVRHSFQFIRRRTIQPAFSTRRQ